mmetsp:Transcript_9042/g.22805  ORF Transcript_9042/g.22805 Transcript_9042/m.22805 type:complete len:239 (-) Transcript_9042:484-1200(-)
MATNISAFGTFSAAIAAVQSSVAAATVLRGSSLVGGMARSREAALWRVDVMISLTKGWSSFVRAPVPKKSKFSSASLRTSPSSSNSAANSVIAVSRGRRAAADPSTAGAATLPKPFMLRSASPAALRATGRSEMDIGGSVLERSAGWPTTATGGSVLVCSAGCPTNAVGGSVRMCSAGWPATASGNSSLPSPARCPFKADGGSVLVCSAGWPTATCSEGRPLKVASDSVLVCSCWGTN